MSEDYPAPPPELSPAAQAVLDAFNSGFNRPVAVHLKPRLAAALRALAVRIKGADNIRQDVLDIADELDGATTTSEND
jgi:hypothetical protein